MAFVRTKSCHRHGHPEFRIAYDPSIVLVADDVDWFVSWLEESVAQGTRYKPGQTCQVGWITTEIRQRPDGDLCIWEPDMQQRPVVWQESVSRTLADLRMQKDVVESVLDAADMAIPSMRQSAIVCTRFGEDDNIVMERRAPDGTVSGWFFGCIADDHDHNDVAELKRVSLYEAVVCCSRLILPFLALPEGTLISMQIGVPFIILNDEQLSFKPGSYLARLYRFE